MNNRLVLVSLLSLIFFTVQPTYARHQSGHQGPGAQAKVDLEKKLNLTKEQIKQIKDIKDAAHDNMKDMRKQKWALYEQMVMMSHNKDIDQNKLNTLISDMNALSEKMIRQEIDMKHKIYLALTPEQQAKLDELTKKRLNHMKTMYGN